MKFYYEFFDNKESEDLYSYYNFADDIYIEFKKGEKFELCWYDHDNKPPFSSTHRKTRKYKIIRVEKYMCIINDRKEQFGIRVFLRKIGRDA